MGEPRPSRTTWQFHRLAQEWLAPHASATCYVAVFAIAFGIDEAVVVVYLRGAAGLLSDTAPPYSWTFTGIGRGRQVDRKEFHG